MSKARTPRKLKKQLKKNNIYEQGCNLTMCLVCQKKPNGHGYDSWWCKDCWEK